MLTKPRANRLAGIPKSWIITMSMLPNRPRKTAVNHTFHLECQVQMLLLHFANYFSMHAERILSYNSHLLRLGACSRHSACFGLDYGGIHGRAANLAGAAIQGQQQVEMAACSLMAYTVNTELPTGCLTRPLTFSQQFRKNHDMLNENVHKVSLTIANIFSGRSRHRAGEQS